MKSREDLREKGERENRSMADKRLFNSIFWWCPAKVHIAFMAFHVLSGMTQMTLGVFHGKKVLQMAHRYCWPSHIRCTGSVVLHLKSIHRNKFNAHRVSFCTSISASYTAWIMWPLMFSFQSELKLKWLMTSAACIQPAIERLRLSAISRSTRAAARVISI